MTRPFRIFVQPWKMATHRRLSVWHTLSKAYAAILALTGADQRRFRNADPLEQQNVI